MPSLKPYARATTVTVNGSEQKFTKGDIRPIQSVIKWANAHENHRESMIYDVTEKMAMYDSGYFPKFPNPVGCLVCDSQEWCSRSDTASDSND